MAVALCTDFQYAPHSMIITQRIVMPQCSQAHTKNVQAQMQSVSITHILYRV